MIIAGIALAEYQYGDHVTNFTLPDTGRNPVSLYDYSDQIVMLFFWEPT
jgi:peroxiredoxin